MKKNIIKSIVVFLAGIGIAVSLPVGAVMVSVPSATQYGQIPIGLSTGNYSPTATSSLGLPTFASLSSYLPLSSWYATTTDGLDEGLLNKYFSDSLVDTWFSTKPLGMFWSTTSADHWYTLQNRASTTLLGDANTWSGANVFSNALSTFAGVAAKATILENARTINGTSFNGSANITITAASSTLLGDNNAFSNALSTFAGTAAKATVLATPRAINGVNFDGSAPITITAASSTLLGDINTWSQTNQFAKLTFTNATGTNATTTNLATDSLCLSGDCKKAWPTGGGSGVGTIATSTVEVAGQIPFYSTNGGYPALLSGDSNLTWNDTGRLLSIGGGAGSAFNIYNSGADEYVLDGSGVVIIQAAQGLKAITPVVIEDRTSGFGITLDTILLSASRNVAFPDKDGTVAYFDDITNLESWSTSNFVPYTGASGDADLGAYALQASLIRNASGAEAIGLDAGTNLRLYQQPASYIQLYSNVTGNYANLDAHSLTANRTYTMPDQSGTLAMLSDIGGATASSTLYADSGTFSGINVFNNKVGIGTSSPFATLSIVGNTPTPEFVVAKTDGGIPLFQINATTSSNRPLENALIGIDYNESLRGVMLDPLHVDRINTGYWNFEQCTANGSDATTQIIADTTKACGVFSYIEDANGALDFFDLNNGKAFSLRAGATGVTNIAGDGMGIGFLGGAAFVELLSSSTPIFEAVAKINAQNSSSSVFVIGIANKITATADFATIPTAGVFFSASSSANYFAQCRTGGGNDYYVDTGIATTSVANGTDANFKKFRIEATSTGTVSGKTGAIFYIQNGPNAPMLEVARCTNITNSLNSAVAPVIGVGKTAAGLSPSLYVKSVRYWWKTAL